MTTETPRPRILIAGIAGASLGTEIAKCLRHAGGYEIFGCDISPYAYGHYDPNFENTFLVERGRYIVDLLARRCKRLHNAELRVGCEACPELF